MLCLLQFIFSALTAGSGDHSSAGRRCQLQQGFRERCNGMAHRGCKSALTRGCIWRLILAPGWLWPCEGPSRVCQLTYVPISPPPCRAGVFASISPLVRGALEGL